LKGLAGHSDFLGGAGGKVEVSERALLLQDAVGCQAPVSHRNLLEVGEIIPVLDFDPAFSERGGAAVDILIDMLDLVQPGMGLAVGRHEAVATKVLVAGRAGRAVVAAKGPEAFFAGGSG